MTRTLLRGILLLGLLAGLVLALWLMPSLANLHTQLRDWRTQFDLLGLVLIALAITPSSLMFVPASLLLLLAGYFYDLVPATLAASLGTTLAAGILFLVGRFLARDWVAGYLARRRLFQALDHAVAHQGFRIVVLTRLSPFFPFVFLNYAFSLTRISFRTYLLGTWIGMIPNVLLWVYLGSTMQNLEQLLQGKIDSGGGLQMILTLAGLVITLVVSLLVARLGRQALCRVLHEEAKTAVPADLIEPAAHLSASLSAASSPGN
jgi:uncharacterized membrane protein YdjX (TVP38/TMEM64 family)